MNADGKREALIEGTRRPTASVATQIIGIGDGANDLKFMAECGVSVAYHAKPGRRGNRRRMRSTTSTWSGVLHLFN